MLQYPTPSDLHYGDVGDTSMPQGGTQWGPGRPDSSHPAVNADTDDRQRAQQLRASQHPPSNYTPATTYMITSRDSYPAQAQSYCSGQYAYPSQSYPATVNYVSPPYDFAEYPINAVNAHHGGQYPPHVSATAHYQYPPSDPAISFHSSAYDSVGYFPSDGPLCSPLEGQHQHGLVPVPSGYSHYDDCLGHYEHYAQPPIPPILSSSSSSELGHALVETPPPESQPINHGSIVLPSLPMPSSSAINLEQSETLVGLNPVKTEYASGVNGQPFSPMTSLSTLPLSNELASHPKEEGQEHTHVFSTLVGTHGHPHHRPHANDSFRLQDPAMYLGHTSPPPSKRHPPPPSLAIPGQLAYSPGARNPTPLSSSFSSSDIGTPTSSIHLDTNAASSSQVAPPVSAPNPKAGQGVLKLPSTKRSARRKPAIACLFCRERKIACGAPPVGSADPTCNQCARRSRKCEYPTMSRRGLHKRRDNGGSHHKESEDADYVPNP
ncbi:hypothetical protein EDB92DRAFT_729603 [Lactarius akahatsu]|uniref:Zn(2)-C6 fungal-type domain-containing protein n=1 Tax=Lactarius akahatsu TaxID=416441 RepID=A0AAD4QAH8_9AGAM|nr:hypothetical protein EDB92DRAFT_729603 [Lactarius akahatsu]